MLQLIAMAKKLQFLVGFVHCKPVNLSSFRGFSQSYEHVYFTNSHQPVLLLLVDFVCFGGNTTETPHAKIFVPSLAMSFFVENLQSWPCTTNMSVINPLMDIYGYLWIVMDIYGYLWIFMDIYGYFWIFIPHLDSGLVTKKTRPEISEISQGGRSRPELLGHQVRCLRSWRFVLCLFQWGDLAQGSVMIWIYVFIHIYINGIDR